MALLFRYHLHEVLEILAPYFSYFSHPSLSSSFPPTFTKVNTTQSVTTSKHQLISIISSYLHSLSNNISNRWSATSRVDIKFLTSSIHFANLINLNNQYNKHNNIGVNFTTLQFEREITLTFRTLKITYFHNSMLTRKQWKYSRIEAKPTHRKQNLE